MNSPVAVLNISGTRWLMPPLPAEPKLTCPGRAFAYAMNSCRFCAGSFGLTSSASGCIAVRAMGVKSLSVE